MEQLNKKEIHQLAMQEVGNFLKIQGYEFLGVNSDMKQSPQFVCVKKKLLYFIVVYLDVYIQILLKNMILNPWKK